MKLLALTTSATLLAVFCVFFAYAEDGEVNFEPQKTYLTIYLESLCRYSAEFILTQLAPNYDSIKDKVTVEMRSCGKVIVTTMRDGSIESQCQHGDEECWGNKCQNCGWHLIDNEEDRVKFIICTMTNITVPIDYSHCCDQVNIRYEDVVDCANSTMGDMLMKECDVQSADYMAESHKVPIVVWGDSIHPQFDANADAFMKTDFKGWIEYVHRVDDAAQAAANAEADAEDSDENSDAL